VNQGEAVDFLIWALAAFSIAATAVHVATTWIVGSLAQRAKGRGEVHCPLAARLIESVVAKPARTMRQIIDGARRCRRFGSVQAALA
jgi:hypothetical protein